MKRAMQLAAATGAFLLAASATAKNLPPPDFVVASAGNQVVVVNPRNGATRSFEAGTVGKLFPAPGGVLFAPDLVHGKTTVLDLRRLRVADRLQGVTMPRFGPATDRYLVVAGNVLIVSYPDRATLARIPADIAHPWQVAVTEDGGTALILERLPGDHEPPVLWAIDLIERRVSLRVALPPDVHSMGFSSEHGVIALAGGSTVRVVAPATLATLLQLKVPGEAVAAAFAAHGEALLVATAAGGTGSIQRFGLKVGHKGLHARRLEPVRLSAAPTGMAVSPEEGWAAVATAGGGVSIVRVDKGTIEQTAQLPGTARDVVWSDPARPGPALPQWSVTTQGQPIKPTPRPSWK
ncbi:MAG: hypothetical protein LJE95_15790 [Acidobacteria bacterium]|nr:hypothetical protein [Acidobacteriota bacterium]